MRTHFTGSLTRGSAQRGSAVLIVLILLSIMAVLVVSNSVTLRQLKVELQLLEQKQERKFDASRIAIQGESGK